MKNWEFIVDGRELRGTRRFLSDFKYITGNIEAGDYGAWTEDGYACLCERKTIADACDSIQNGKLFRQIDELFQYTPVPVLLVSGSFEETQAKLKKDAGFDLNRNVFIGALASIVVRTGIPLVLVEHQRRTCPECGVQISPEPDNTLVHLAHRICQKVVEGKFLIHDKIKARRVERSNVNMLTCIHGISPRIATDVLKNFKIRLVPKEQQSAFTPTAEAFTKITGIGKSTALNIEKCLNFG